VVISVEDSESTNAKYFSLLNSSYVTFPDLLQFLLTWDTSSSTIESYLFSLPKVSASFCCSITLEVQSN
jgi:hypothetical protein